MNDSINDGPVVSVIVPAYNAIRWIKLSLASVMAQTLQNIEIIVVDDGSSDGTPEVVAGIALRDSRVRLIRRNNGGVGAARNTGILAAGGRFIAPLDADDLWYPEKLEKQVSCIERRGRRTAMIYCWYEQVDENGNILGAGCPFTVEGSARGAIILRNFVGNASVPLFRAEAIEQTGLYLTREEQKGVQGCEDWDMSIRLAESWDVGVVPEVLVGYRQTTSCMSLSTFEMAASFRVVIERARQRNRDLPTMIFRWSEGHFQSYLVAQSYCSCDYRSCLVSVARAILSDPLMILNQRLYEMTAKSLIRLAIGKRRSPSKNKSPSYGRTAADTPPPFNRTLFERLQKRRWSRVVENPSSISDENGVATPID